MRRTRWPGSVLLLALLLSIDSTAEPMNLLDPTPRSVEVAFEVSPRDKPTQTDTVYTPNLVADLEPMDVPGQIRITIDRRDVESVLLAGHHVVPGSVSDFVWVFDADSGEVLSASLSGRLVKELDWGLFHSTAEAQIELDMETRRVAGVDTPRRWLGQQLFGYCDDPSQRSCQLVSGRSYDRQSGYVYAVGALQVHFGKIVVPTFSPLGEAVFAEIEGARAGPAVATARGDREQQAASAFSSLVAADSQDQPVLPVVSAGPSY